MRKPRIEMKTKIDSFTEINIWTHRSLDKGKPKCSQVTYWSFEYGCRSYILDTNIATLCVL